MRKLNLEELNRIDPEGYKAAQKIPVVVVLDNIRSMHNVGSAFRTCDAFRVEKIFLCGITAKPPHRDIHKTALGATETVTWEYQENIKELVEQISRDYKIIIVEQTTDSLSLQQFKPDRGESYCLVFGNEVFGISDEVIPLANGSIEIPQFGTKHSLNVSVSIGIVLWDMYQKAYI